MREKISFSSDLPQSVVDEYGEFIKESGQLKWRVLAACIKLIKCAPPDVRDLAFSGDEDGLRQWFSERNQERADVLTLRAAIQEAEKWRDELLDGNRRKGHEKR